MESMTVQVLRTELEAARESLDRALAGLAITETDKGFGMRESVPRNPTIELITENGFTIERVCERGGSTASDSASGCHFVVRGPNGDERRISVRFAGTVIRQVRTQPRRSKPLPLDSGFWLQCAERQLATYLWHNDEYPPEGKLIVDELSIDELDFAIRSND